MHCWLLLTWRLQEWMPLLRFSRLASETTDVDCDFTDFISRPRTPANAHRAGAITLGRRDTKLRATGLGMLSKRAVFEVAIMADHQRRRNRRHRLEISKREILFDARPNFSSPAHRYGGCSSGFVETLGDLPVQSIGVRTQFASKAMVRSSSQEPLDQRHNGRSKP